MDETGGYSPENEQKPEKVTLEDVLDFDREIPQEYQRLIKESCRRYFYTDTAYSDRWGSLLYGQQVQHAEGSLESHFRKGLELVKQHVTGKVIVDIGGGNYSSRIAEDLGAIAYINIDLAFTDENPPKSNPLVVVQEYGGNCMDICSDALDFVSRIKDNRVCFMLNGTDIFLSRKDDYTRSLVKEIERATIGGGLVFGVGRPSIDEIIEDRIENGDTTLARAVSKDGYRASVATDSFIFLKSESDKE